MNKVLIHIFSFSFLFCSCSSLKTDTQRSPASNASSIFSSCTTAIKQILRIQEKPIFGMKEGQTFISHYIASSRINKIMRNSQELQPDEIKYINGLTQELKKYPTYEGRALRAVKFDFDFIEQYKVGEIVEEVAFTSASKGDGANLMGDTIFYDLLFIFDSKTARDISATNPSEREIIFLPHSRFEVESIKGNFKFNDITMEQNMSALEYDQDIMESLPYERGIKNFTEYKSYFSNFDLEKMKKELESEHAWVLEEWKTDISEIKTLEDLIKLGFDPVVEVHLSEK